MDIESGKAPQESFKDNVTKGNEAFISNLQNATSIEDIIEAAKSFSFKEYGEEDDGADNEAVVYEVSVDEEGVTDLTNAIGLDALVTLLNNFKEAPPVDAQNVDEWVDHKDIAAALKRVLNLS